MGQKIGLWQLHREEELIEAAEMKLLRPLAGYNIQDQKTKNLYTVN